MGGEIAIEKRGKGVMQVLLRGDHPPVALIVEHLQDVKRLEDPPVVRERLAESGRAAVAGDHPDQVVRADGSGRERGRFRS